MHLILMYMQSVMSIQYTSERFGLNLNLLTWFYLALHKSQLRGYCEILTNDLQIYNDLLNIINYLPNNCY